MKIILILLFTVFLATLLFGVKVLVAIFRWVLGLPPVKPNANQTRQQRQAPRATAAPTVKKRDKVFKDDDGEYVDYEEVK